MLVIGRSLTILVQCSAYQTLIKEHACIQKQVPENFVQKPEEMETIATVLDPM